MFRKAGKKDSRCVAKLVTGDRAPCAFCRRDVDDEVTFGKLYAIGDIHCHYLCALLSCCLVQNGPEDVGLFGFMYKDILAELERSKKHKCSFCGRGGANLGCSVSSCRKQFHLPCGRERNAVSLFHGSFKSFCEIHAPRQRILDHIMCKAKLRMKDAHKNIVLDDNAVQASEEGMVCVICYEAVDAFPTVNTFWPSCCGKDAWFHRSCLQRMALSAGMHYLKCPLCNDKEHFYDAVKSQGYYVPDRDAAWELEQNAFAEIYERPLTCSAETCQCPDGRSHDADQGMWDIKLCLLCGSMGAHAQCIGASETTRYVCLTCTPAAPADMQALADTIEKLVLEEKAIAASNVRQGPVMPSRLSLRRTKGRLAMINKPSGSREHDIKTKCASPAPSPNIQSSRLELNLKTPRKLADSYKSDSLRKSIHTNTNTENNSLTKPLEHLNDLYRNTESYKNIEARLLSPLKHLEQSFKDKVGCMGGDAVLDDRVVDILRSKFNKPRPLSEKKKIIDDILNGLFDNYESPLKQKEPMRLWCSPNKCSNTDEEMNQTAESQISTDPVENKENCMQDTPRKSKRIDFNASTPNKVDLTPRFDLNASTPNKVDLTPRLIEIETKYVATNKDSKTGDDKHVNEVNHNEPNNLKEIEATNDDSSNKVEITPRINEIETKDVATNKDSKTGDDKHVNEVNHNELNDLKEIEATNDDSSNKVEVTPRINEIETKDVATNKDSKTGDDKHVNEVNHNGLNNLKEIEATNADSSNKIEITPRINEIETKDVATNEDYKTGDGKHVNEVNNDEQNDLKEIEGNDDSSNSTFQLPSEFIAEALSDDSCMTFQSSKPKTIEIKDSSLELSEQDHSVNIDLIKINDRTDNLDAPVKQKSLFRFSRLDTETMDEGDVNMDLESFKKEYLNEVNSNYKCCFKHNHDHKNASSVNVNFRTVIDFAIEAHLHKESVEDKPGKKRKLSEGSLVLSYDTKEVKKRKISENILNSSISNDDFETQNELKSSVKQVEITVNKVSDENKTQKITTDKKKKHETSKRKQTGERGQRKRSNRDTKIRTVDRCLLTRKLESKQKRAKDRKVETEERLAKRIKSNDEKNTLKNDNRSLAEDLLKKRETKEKHENKTPKSKEIIIKNNTENKRSIQFNSNDENKIKRDRERERNLLNKKKEKPFRSNDGNNKQRDKEKRGMMGKDIKDKKINAEDKHVKHKTRSNQADEKRTQTNKLKMTDEKTASGKKKDSKNSDKYTKDRKRYRNSEKYVKDRKTNDGDRKHDRNSEKYVDRKTNDGDQNIEVTIDSSKGKSDKKTKTKLSISNRDKNISVKIQWRKKLLSLKIKSKKDKAVKIEKDHSKFKQYVLQYFSDATPKEVLVKPEKEVGHLKRKYVKQEKSPDKLKQMSIQNFFKVKSPE